MSTSIPLFQGDQMTLPDLTVLIFKLQVCLSPLKWIIKLNLKFYWLFLLITEILSNLMLLIIKVCEIIYCYDFSNLKQIRITLRAWDSLHSCQVKALECSASLFKMWKQEEREFSGPLLEIRGQNGLKLSWPYLPIHLSK